MPVTCGRGMYRASYLGEDSVVTDQDEQGRPEPPIAGDESATLLGYLDFQRATMAWKCSGVDEARPEGDHRPLVDDPRRNAQTHGLC